MSTELTKVARMAFKSKEVKQKVGEACGVAEDRIYYWLRVNSKNLLRIDVLSAISDVTGLSIDQLITKVQTEAA